MLPTSFLETQKDKSEVRKPSGMLIPSVSDSGTEQGQDLALLQHGGDHSTCSTHQCAGSKRQSVAKCQVPGTPWMTGHISCEYHFNWATFL
jgi:hypothetical protein